MEPENARAEAERWLGISAKLLAARDLVGSRSFAIRARDADPTNPITEQILAVVDTLIAAEKRVINSGHHDWYSILQLSHLVRDPDLIASQYRRLVLLLNPDHNHLPFADFALRVVVDAWSVLSDPTKKWIYDSELANFLQRSGASHEPEPVRVDSSSSATYQFFQQQPPPQQPPPPQPQQWIHHLQQQEQPQPQLQERQLFQQQHHAPPPQPPPAQSQPQWLPHTQPQTQSQQRSSQPQWLPQQHHQPPPQPHPPQQTPQWMPEQQRQPPPPKDPQILPHFQRQPPPPPQSPKEPQIPPQFQRQPPPPTQSPKEPQIPPQFQRQIPPPQPPKEPQIPPQFQRQTPTSQPPKEPQIPSQFQRQTPPPPQPPKEPQIPLQFQRQTPPPQPPTEPQIPPQFQRQTPPVQPPKEPQVPAQLQRQPSPQPPKEPQVPPQIQRQPPPPQPPKESKIPAQIQRQPTPPQPPKEPQIPQLQRQQQNPQTKKQRTPLPPPPPAPAAAPAQPVPPQQPPQQPTQQIPRENNGEIGRASKVSQVTNEKVTHDGNKNESAKNNVTSNDHDNGTQIESFWTACPYCYYLYEYPKTFQECILRCQNCRRAFQAIEIPKPPSGKEPSFCSWGVFPIGFSINSWKKNMPFGSNGNGFGSNWVPFSPMFACPVQGLKKRVYRTMNEYHDDDNDDYVSDPSDDSDSSDDWVSSTRSGKRQGSARGGRGRPPGRKSNTERDQNPVNQNSVGVTRVVDSEMPRNDVVNKAVVSGGLKKQTGKGVRGRKKLDLNVEFSNEVEDHAPATRDANGEEVVGFFEGLDEFLSTLPILHVVGDDKAKAS